MSGDAIFDVLLAMLGGAIRVGTPFLFVSLGECLTEKAGRINQPFNRPFYDIKEVRLVRGMDMVEAVRPDWQQWFTVWSGGALDLNEASAELIAAAAECSVEQAGIIPQTVSGVDGQRVRFRNRMRDRDEFDGERDVVACAMAGIHEDVLGADANLHRLARGAPSRRRLQTGA